MKADKVPSADEDEHRMSSLMRFAPTAVMAIALIALLPTASRSEQIPALCSKERNQAEMTRCADQLLRKDTAEMKKTLDALLKETDKDDQKYVTEAQAAWQAYADKE